MDDWLTDEMRGRAVGFWSRGVLGTWPIEAQGYVFLGNAVLAAGARLFGQEWTGQEPWRCQLPILDRSRSYAADGFDAVYAVNLLGEYMPELGIGPMLDWSLREKPLSHEQWKLAFDIYKDHAAQQNLLATTRMQSVARQLIEAAASGTLATATRSQSGKYVPIDREKWNSEIAFGHFRECQMNPQQPDPITVPLLFGRTEGPLLQGSEWIFVTRESLDATIGIRTPTTQPSTDARNTTVLPHQESWDQGATWLRQQVDAWRGGGERLSRSGVEQALYEQFGIRSPTARDIWKEIAPPEWLIRGRRKKAE